MKTYGSEGWVRWMGRMPNGERRVEKNKLIISILMYANEHLL